MKKRPRLAICILEDDRERQAAMRQILDERFYQYPAVFFNDARKMIDYLRESLATTVLICLDHDLELIPNHKGKSIDPGTGRDVADWLADQAPVCPLIIHSTNSPAALAMQTLLEEKGWKTARVTPWGDLEWIEQTWKRAVRTALVDSAKPVTRAAKTPAAR